MDDHVIVDEAPMADVASAPPEPDEPKIDPSDEFAVAADKFKLKVERDEDGNVLIGDKEKPLLKVVGGKFVSLVDHDRTGVRAGQVLEPSSQDNVAEHAATCARDLGS